jgi:hypothetical protein
MDKPSPKLYRRRRGARTTAANFLKNRLKPLQEFVRHFEWIHISLGIFGNLAFLVGSIFFLWETMKTAGVWLFIVGSLGMLISSIGSAIVQAERR